jgi:hypothetical protein
VGLAVGLAVGVAVAVAVAALGLADGEVGAGVGRMPEMQVDALMVSLMRVTSPVLANTRPSTVTPAPTVIEVDAMTVPTKVGASSVAELPICQNTLHGEAPSVSTTLPSVVPRVCDAPVWKMNTPGPCSVSGFGPFMVNDPSEGDWYTPEVRVTPLRSTGSEVLVGVSAAAALYAVVRSFWAPSATLPLVKMLYGGSTSPGGKPVTAEPGSTPKSPEMVVEGEGPELVLVTVVAARTAKGVAVPRFTVVAAANAANPPKVIKMAAAPNPNAAPTQRARLPACDPGPLI